MPNLKKRNIRSRKVRLTLQPSIASRTSGKAMMTYREVVNTVMGTTSNAGADVVTTVPITFRTNAFSIKGFDEAGLYIRFRIRKCRIVWKNVLTSTSYGLAALGILDDPYAAPPTVCTAIAQCSGGKIQPIYKEMSISVPVDDTWKYTTALAADFRLSDYGNLFFGTTATSAAQFPGFLEMFMTVEFAGQRWQ